MQLIVLSVLHPIPSRGYYLGRVCVCVCECKEGRTRKEDKAPSLVRSITMDPAAGKSPLNSQRSRPALVE